MNSTRKLPSPDDPQYDLFDGVPSSSSELVPQTAVHSGRRFVTGDAKAIFLGPVRLEDHLKRSGQHAPFAVARLLGEQDWQAFEQRYAATGRAPYAPLVAEGFDVDSYVDIFDGGPIAEARVAMLRSVVSAQNVELRGGADGGGEACLVANTERAGFRATLTHGEFLDDALLVQGPAIQQLGLAEGMRACAVRLD